ncbi:helicase-exonuclease AddAB subunit AddB [Bacillus massilinigeriensis]|uniref:helicase-exonuclease AddAB subunit AddB n=1 Tax=Bacillus massilionigeriensis TaxID=1805475 RepID=UPI00096B518C|nr:helicase-exonuclease AddAB subunit AddB [Bacillus massilionigeriensis]
MSVRMLIGRAGSGKTNFCLEEIQQKMLTNPDGNPIIYIVPDQMTFLSEYKLISNPHIGGMVRTQVFSFSRLAFRVLQETGGISRYHLSNVGISMLIRKIIDDKKEQFRLYQNAADKNGFIAQMEQMLAEFKRYCVSPEELFDKRETFEYIDGRNELQDKLHDLEMIYQSFEESLFGKYIDSEDYFRLLSEKVSQSTYLQEAEIYIDGFYSFTPQEYMVINQLMKHCQNVTITHTLDRPFYDHSPDELHLFRMTGENYQTLYEMAKVEGLQVEEIEFAEPKRWKHNSLIHLERYFDSRPAIPFEEDASIYIAEAVNRRAEVEGIARNIKRLAQSNNYRFRDMAILLRNGQDYRDLIETVFYDYEIPYFIDQKRTMLNHPLIELIRSSLEIINSYWRYEPVFRAVKTELLFPLDVNPVEMREQMDKLENYVLAYGIQGEKWTNKERWKYRKIKGLELVNTVQTDAEKYVEQKMNELRMMITAPILRLSRRLKKAKNARELCEGLFLYLEELDIPAKLEGLKQVEEDNGNLVKAREHDQAWNATLELLDQFVEMLGEEEITVKQFSSILDAGIESLRFSLVPPAMDQVLIADLEKSRVSDIKVAFVIGLTEGVLPAKFQEDGLLADDDREQLLRSGLRIAPSSRTRLLDEEFIAYSAFTTPSELLYVSYPLANAEGKAIIPSIYIKRLSDLFPSHHLLSFMTDPTDLSEQQQLEYCVNPNTTLSYLTTQLQLKKRNYPIYDFWWDIYNYYMKDQNWRGIVGKILSSLTYENRPNKLSEKVSREIYGDVIQASVSRMELFQSCAFSHFASHGLKLRERQIFRLAAPDIGELFHAALKYVVETVTNQHLSWSSISKEEMESLAKQAVDTLGPKLQNEILLSSNRHFYIKRKLEQIISRASWVLREHAKASGFAPVGLELSFGPKGELPALSFPLKNGRKMELIGRIDRVDKAEEKDGTFLRVIDYKSSSKDLNVHEVYYGLALQMLTYLDIIITHSKELIGKEADPAGVLYFHVHNPMIQASKMLSLDEIEDEILKKYKMNGLILEDEKVIRLMDQTLETGGSKIISARINKDGSLAKSSKVANKEDFNHLRQYVRELYVKTGNEISEGTVSLSPYKLKDKTPCTFCSFKSVCQFDESLGSNSYRVLPIKSKEEVLNLLREEVKSNE